MNPYTYPIIYLTMAAILMIYGQYEMGVSMIILAKLFWMDR